MRRASDQESPSLAEPRAWGGALPRMILYDGVLGGLMAEDERHENSDMMHRPTEPPDFYTDGTSIEVTPYTVTLALAVSDGGAARPVANIRMSPTHAKVLTMLLRQYLKQAEETFGDPIPVPSAVLQGRGLSLEDW